jgi:hypothetical protein
MLTESFNLFTFRNFLLISPQQKVLKLTTSGSLTIPSPLAFAEGLFFINYFSEKEGFREIL